MLGNDMRIAIRNLLKNKVFSIINMAGLAIGISASLVIFLIVNYEFSFEKNWKNASRIYRVVSVMHFPNQLFPNSGSPGPLGKAIKQELPELEQAALLSQFYQPKVQVGTEPTAKTFRKQEAFVYAEEDFFKIFPHDWIAGNSKTSLSDPYKIVLSESNAKLYFPDQSFDKIVGQQLIVDDTIKLMVSGIVRDIIERTEINFKAFVSFSTFNRLGLDKETGFNEWGSISSNNQLFVQLRPGVDTSKLNRQLTAVQTKNSREGMFLVEHAVQPLSDIHFNEVYGGFAEQTANRKVLYGLLAVAAFLMTLGCINFINLTTAQSSQRAKEIGIRKTLGSSRKKLIGQFLGETFVVAFISTIVSVILTPWLLKIFADFTPAGLKFNLIQEPAILIFLVLLVIVVTFLSGFYPAIILSGFKPVSVLKNQVFSKSNASRTEWLRKSLTVSQFIIAQFFIIATLVVGKQIHYSVNMNMGFEKEAILNVNTPYNINDFEPKLKLFVQKLKSIPEIRQISLSGAPPAREGLNMTSISYKDGKKEIKSTVEIQVVDTAFYALYKLKLLAGRWLESADTTREYVINEKFARELGFQNPSDALNKFVNRGDQNIPIVGVVADFHSRSVHEPIQTLVFASVSSRQRVVNIALQPGVKGADTWKRAIEKLTTAYKEVYPENDIEYSFLDDGIAAMYKLEQKISKLLNWAAGLALFISCLGLFGLVIYTSNQRVKEIGIRKVLGASVGQIVSLLCRDFLRLVFLALVIATPIGWWATHTWLEGFAFRTNLSWWVFGLSGMLMVVLALVTLGFKTVKAAMGNPVTSLRNE